ncbi:hypothetical protein CJF42_16115 [Pseudoalteromonas sp. NBT06-2]|uniref:hypothetical protein n=1 Tax=Pseudoalteromonas sp. NBT06-2 TaxID=2025950 RepID=UPI000BA71449|nr:hypothetical protein [Pseudoalteromonas sp. NBT06-2]PAJ73389.1 hypothetical protein CJF42_16115 [Pseudoalteromonas sp. NBT06-2]
MIKTPMLLLLSGIYTFPAIAIEVVQQTVAEKAVEAVAKAKKAKAEAVKAKAEAVKTAETAADALAVVAEETARLAEKAAEEVAKSKSKGSTIFDDLGFGMGISYTMNASSGDRVKSATVVDGIVRVDKESNGTPRIVLEAHYIPDYNQNGRGFGPFVALQPGDENIISAVALGGMYAWKRDDEGNSFNIGVGIVADPNTQVLGDGIIANEPLPGNEIEIRYKEETSYGVMILFSTTW